MGDGIGDGLGGIMKGNSFSDALEMPHILNSHAHPAILKVRRENARKIDTIDNPAGYLYMRLLLLQVDLQDNGAFIEEEMLCNLLDGFVRQYPDATKTKIELPMDE